MNKLTMDQLEQKLHTVHKTMEHLKHLAKDDALPALYLAEAQAVLDLVNDYVGVWLRVEEYGKEWQIVLRNCPTGRDDQQRVYICRTTREVLNYANEVSYTVVGSRLLDMENRTDV